MAFRTRPDGPGARLAASRARDRFRAFRILAALALLASAAACGGTGPSPTGPSPGTASPPAAAAATSAGPPASSSIAPSPSASQDLSADLAAVEAQTEAIRGLAARSPIEPRFIDETDLKRMLTADLDAQQSARLMADAERLYRGLGLYSGDRTLRDLGLEMLESQVIGMYRPSDKTLYVVERSEGFGTMASSIEEYTFSHEFTHALQDQHFDIGSLGLKQVGQGDRALARVALLEGDASLASTFWALRNLTAADFLNIQKLAADPVQQKLLADLPPIIRETQVMFPYIQGATFVESLWAQGGWKSVDNAYADPPLSTEQILHPGKYRAGEKPVTVTLPDGLAGRLGAGWSLAMEDTLGELQLRVLLQTANDATDATAAAADWGGDRVGLYRGPDGAWAIVLATAWDTPTAADRFKAAAMAVAAGLPHARVVPGEQGPMLLVGSSASTLDDLGVHVGAP